MTRTLRRLLAALDESDIVLLAAVFMLCLVGTRAVFGAGSFRPEAVSGAFGQSHYLVKQLLRLGLGIVVLVALAHLDYRLLGRRPIAWGLLAAGLLFVALPILLTHGQFRRWFGFFGLFPVQPLELAKIAVVIFLAERLAKLQSVGGDDPRTTLPALLVGPLLLIVILVLQPNYSNALVIGGVSVVILFAADVRLRWLAIPMCFLAASAALGIAVISKLNYRISSWVRGILESDYAYQVDQSLIGLGAGGWHGLGLGNSHNKFAFLPESHTDFVFSVLGEELGCVGTLAVVGLFLVLAWRGVDIAKRAADPFGSLLATGLTALIFAYAALNMAMVVGIFPVMGVPLPFVSYGGSALVTNLAAVGILLSVDRRGRAHERWLRRWRRT